MMTSTGNCYNYYTQCYYTISTVVTKQSQVRVFTLLSPPDDHVSLLDHVPYTKTPLRQRTEVALVSVNTKSGRLGFHFLF